MVEKILPPDYPITDIFIVSEKSYCPSGYQVIDLTTDGQDADLWKDSFLKKTKRYLCFTRKLPTPDGSNTMVLKDLAIIKENGQTPERYTALNVTKDTAEPSLKKKQIMVQYANRVTSGPAICEVFLTKNTKYPIAESHGRGEINGLTLSIRYGTGPKPAPILTAVPEPTPRPRPVPAPRTQLTPNTQSAPITRSGTMRAHQLHYQPLDGVTFQINSTFKSLNSMSSYYVPKIPYLTPEQIEEKYKYDFQTERIAERRIVNP
ncbi:multivesicular body subunit 12B-like [Antedon mediterranea]|uniref:multivesicular body subunit 12B-like n=1 Tax=Antedon mediterranea TaxID=105859 RepID=UPI003AF665B9